MSEELKGVFGDEDRAQLDWHGIELDDVARQLACLRSPGGCHRTLDRAASLNDGVRHVDLRMVPDLLFAAGDVRHAGRVSKFVPASGAATRMFQSLLRAVGDHARGALDDDGRRVVDEFLSALPRLALRHELARQGIAWNAIPRNERERFDLVRRILGPDEGGVAGRPKGLVPFHDEADRGRTPFEEHLHEALLYTTDARNVARAHFTVPDDARGAFEATLEELRPRLENDYYATLDVTFSSQRRSTDTICVDENGAPLRTDDGRLVLRPGGHGALLHNLEETQGDIVVIKNIDNVVPARGVKGVVHWQNILVGTLATLQHSIRVYLRQIHENGNEPNWLDQALVFAEGHLSIACPPWLRDAGVLAQREFLMSALDRPIRVCGVVRNEDEPGGGPCWVRDVGGIVSLQIVESAEVDLHDVEQARVWRSAMYFNPVDVVVGLRNWRGEPFDLGLFSDPDAAIRTTKSSDGRPLEALERPGLWNGAMARWITLFVEVPISTFAPVKTIFDLLRPEHR